MGKIYSKSKNSDDNERIKYINRSIEIYEELDSYDQKLEYAMCFYYKSSCFQWLGKFSDSIKHIDKCIEILDKMNMENSKEKANCLMEKSYSYFKFQQYKLCVQSGTKALECYNKINDGRSFDAARCLKYMAESSGYLNISSDFVNYYKKALDIFQELKLHKQIAFSLKKLSTAYGKNGDRTKQLEFALQSLKIYQDPSLVDDWKNTEEMASVYMYVGDAYTANGKLAKAREYYNMALEFYNKWQKAKNKLIQKIKRVSRQNVRTKNNKYYY